MRRAAIQRTTEETGILAMLAIGGRAAATGYPRD